MDKLNAFLPEIESTRDLSTNKEYGKWAFTTGKRRMYVEVKEALTKSLDDDDLASVIRILPEEVADLGLATYIKPALEPTKAEKETSRQPLTRDIANGMGMTMWLKWRKLKDGWCVLNTDGYATTSEGKFTCGGVIGDWEGNWITGFTMNLAICSTNGI
nr:non-LTR retroelement reverse transcriptase-like [Ipomoea batatas]